MFTDLDKKVLWQWLKIEQLCLLAIAVSYVVRLLIFFPLTTWDTVMIVLAAAFTPIIFSLWLVSTRSGKEAAVEALTKEILIVVSLIIVEWFNLIHYYVTKSDWMLNGAVMLLCLIRQAKSLFSIKKILRHQREVNQ